jgi:hypothetical protein
MTTLAKPPSAEAPGHSSVRIYLALMVYRALVKVVFSLASVKGVLAVQDQLFRWPVIGAFTVLGGISAWLVPRAGLLESVIAMRTDQANVEGRDESPPREAHDRVPTTVCTVGRVFCGPSPGREHVLVARVGAS